MISKNNFSVGLTNKCRAVPKFINPLKMQTPALDSRQEDGSIGLSIRDYSKKNTIWQHKSWGMSGYIGAFDRDNKGNIYVSPLPYVSLQKNPPELQNQLYIIDATTAEMSVFLKLPLDNKPNSRNPFGVMGVYFDCDTQSMYISSIAGSLPMEEKGVIYQVDINTKKIISTFENVDAIGIGVFNTLNKASGNSEKRLYFGSARNSHLFSIVLDNQGRFPSDNRSKKRYELSLSQIKGGDTTVIKKIKFSKHQNDYYMTLKEKEFGFRLMAENKPFKKKYNFKWDKESNQWEFEGFTKE